MSCWSDDYVCFAIFSDDRKSSACALHVQQKRESERDGQIISEAKSEKKKKISMM